MFKVGNVQVGDHVLDWTKEETVKNFKASKISGETIWKAAQVEKAARKKVADKAKATDSKKED